MRTGKIVCIEQFLATYSETIYLNNEKDAMNLGKNKERLSGRQWMEEEEVM